MSHVVCVRHPDAENTFATFGDVEVIDIDLGSSFSGKPESVEQAREWAQSVWESAKDAPADVSDHVYGVILETVDGYITEPELSQLLGYKTLRTILSHVNVQLAHDDPRTAEDIEALIKGALEVGSETDDFVGVWLSVPMTEEV